MKKKNFPGKRNIHKKSVKKLHATICSNAECKLRKKGCKGSEGCPGYKGK
jgi:hypothetical protein